MGIEHDLRCNDCKQRIDLHKLYLIERLEDMPEPFKLEDADTKFYCGDKSEFYLYWMQRAVWFLLKHRKHDVIQINDCDPNYFDNAYDTYEEVFGYGDKE